MQKKCQSFNDGVVKIYSIANTADPGEMPVDGLTLLVSLRYDERMVGITRYNMAQQSNFRVDRLLRCPLRPDVTTECVAVPNDGKQYDIKMIQRPYDIEPPAMDLSLERRVTDYAIE